jgi:hypothetical protein
VSWKQRIAGRGCDSLWRLVIVGRSRRRLENFYILHYTYGNDYTKKGVFTPGKMGEWRFDKRTYMGRIPPSPLELPPKGTPDSVRTLIEMINEASQALPHWETLGIPP